MKSTLSYVAGAAAAILLTAASASAQEVRMIAVLSPGEETPAPGLLSGAVGTADVLVDVGARELTVTLRVFNLPTASTAGHIHVGPAGIAGPIILDFPATIPGRTGDFTLTFRLSGAALRPNPALGINNMEDAIQSITGGNAYVNVHSTANPGGEIRGQLQLRP
jgi:hypothetical protein